MSEPTDSSGSSPSSSYSSDGPICCSLTNRYDPLTSSDDPDEDTAAVIEQYPTTHLKESDRDKILTLLKGENDTREEFIFPTAILHYMKTKKLHVCERIRNIMLKKTGWGYVSPSLVKDFCTRTTIAKPKNVLCDITILLLNGPLIVITVTNKSDLYENIQKYNVAITKEIVANIQDAGLTLGVIHGVIEETKCHSKVDFMKRLDEMESDARILALPGTMEMDTATFESVTRTFLKLITQSENDGPAVWPTLTHERKRKKEDMLANVEYKAQKEEGADVHEMRRELMELRADVKVLKWKLAGWETTSSFVSASDETPASSESGLGESISTSQNEFEAWSLYSGQIHSRKSNVSFHRKVQRDDPPVELKTPSNAELELIRPVRTGKDSGYYSRDQVKDSENSDDEKRTETTPGAVGGAFVSISPEYPHSPYNWQHYSSSVIPGQCKFPQYPNLPQVHYQMPQGSLPSQLPWSEQVLPKYYSPDWSGSLQTAGSSLIMPRSDGYQPRSNLMPMPHSQSAPLLMETSLSAEFEFKTPAHKMKGTIEIHGSDVSLSGTDKYTFFFENKRRGGGAIEKLEVTEDNILLITFQDSSVAQKLVEVGKAKVGRTQVTIKQHIPLPVYRNKVLLEYKGAHLDHSSMELRYYIEARSGGELTSFEAGSKENALLLTYQEPIDTQMFQSACERRPFRDKSLRVQDVTATNILLVQGVPKSVSAEMLQYHFEAPKSGNITNSEVIRVQVLDKTGDYLVFFVDYRVGTITKVKHSLGGCPVQVRLYHKCIGSGCPVDVTQSRPGTTEEKCLTLDKVDPLKVRFLKKSQPFMSQLQTKTRKQNIFLSIDSDNKLNARRADTSAHSNTNWEEEMLRTCTSIIEETIAQYSFPVPPEFSDKVESIIQEIKFDSTEVKCYTDKSTVVVVGSKSRSASMKEQLENLLQPTTVTNEKVELNKMKPLAACLLSDMNFDDILREIYPEVKVNVDTKANEVHFEGPEDKVTGAKLNMLEIVSSAVTIKLNLSEHQIGVLQKTTIIQEITSRLKKNGIISVWTIKHNMIEVISKSKSDAEAAGKVICAAVIEKMFPIESYMLSVLSSEAWGILCVELKNIFPDTFTISNIENKYLLIVGLNDDVDNVYDRVSSFFAANATETTVIDVPKGIYRFIKSYLANELKRIAKDLESYQVQISYRDDEESGFIVHGSKRGINDCTHRLDKFTAKIRHHKELLQKASMAAKMLTSEKGARLISDVERLHRCTIEIEHETAKAAIITHAVISLAEGRQIYVCEGDITSFSVGALVNAANNRLDLCGGLAKDIAEKGGAIIQDQCTDYVMRYGEVLCGDAVKTSPGAIPCDVLIHAVGPIWVDGKQREKEYLAKTIMKCMELAEGSQCVSVSIPGVSTGIFSYPKDAATRIIISTVRDYFRGNKYSIIKDVYLCDKDTNTVKAFMEALKSVFGERNIHLSSQHRDETLYEERATGVTKGSLQKQRARPMNEILPTRKGPPGDVLVVFFSDTQQAIHNARTKLFDANGKECQKQVIEKEALKTLDDTKRTNDDVAAWTCDIHLEQKGIETDSGGDTPQYWDKMAADVFRVFNVHPGTHEYKLVSAKFAFTNKQIVKIERIQNKTLYKQYQAARQLFLQRSSNIKQFERELWHEATADTLRAINMYGYGRSYCGNEAAFYGNGVYFTVDPSERSTFRTSVKGNSYIYLADVLTGKYTKGNLGMRVPPPVDPASSSVLYDSVVDDIYQPTLFVIFRDTHAYPKYLITFK